MKNKLSLIALAIASLSAQAGEWDYPAGNETVSDQAAAKTYVETHYPDIGSIALRYQSQSKLGRQYNFNITVSGEYKAQRTIVVHTDSSGLVQRVFKSLEDTILRNNVATTAAELEVPRRLKSNASPDVSSGTVVDATVNIVDPDLRTMDKQPAPSSLWADVSDYPNAPRYVERDVEVLSSGGKYYLSNSRVKQVDAEYLEEQDPDTGVWSQSGSASFLAQEGIVEFAQLDDLKNLTFASNDFTQMMAFYHIDQSLQYLSSLGYSLFSEPVVFDARGLSNNNSSYFYGPKAAMFGIGGSPDAIDADVVIHELGHGIHYQIVPDWGYGHTGAIAEGFADYWAGSDSYRKLYNEGSDFEIDTVFNWDGYFGTRVATRSLWNQRARYFEQSEYRAHESVGGELGDELWSTPLFQTLKQGVVKYGDQAFDEVNTIVLESMYGLGRGMKMHDLVESMLHVSEKLYPSREYTALLKTNFAAHDLIKAPFRTEVDKRYVDQSAPLEVRLLSNGRQAKVTGKIAASIGAEQNVETEKFETYSSSLTLPQSATCGDSFTLETAVSYQYDTSLQSQDWTASETLILGIPTLNQQTKVQNSVIPDASVADNGSFNNGFKSFNFIINDDNTVIGDDFGIYLNIEHSSLSDLEVVLVSPSGTRQALMTNEAFSKSSRSMYWVAKHDEAAQAFSGQALAGTWRLEVTDYSQGDTGQLVEWAVGNVESYSCAQSTDNNNSDSGSGGGSVSWGLMFLSGLLFWRREHFKNSTI
ncbi:proprotein convertase P-domain-containing protein [Vibrio coralliilyticus]|uniref:proprotein convertase P-domain-containing protein n=1 Tax=Vibrio coralliilyticus TaxID=190893 RepID=UPI0006CD51EC|nr:proprotein convertase P-domain-containing protein [Vibrio coralliilyticus]AXN34405.1 propeptide, peptidase [Vibrio coralliilyticus]KPH24067.1 propeptide, peptidase [Vibrio coralliilyticus]